MVVGLAAHHRRRRRLVLMRWCWPRRPTSPARLLQPLSHGAAWPACCPQQATSAIVVALAFAAEQAARLRIPRGFGFVVPRRPGEAQRRHPLLACTFVHQKFPGRVPQGAVLLRAFFGGHSGEALLGERTMQLVERARLQLGRVLGPLPEAAETVVRRWPQSLPQYAVGHLDRMAELESMLSTMPGLSSCGQRLLRSGIARSHPSGSRHGSICWPRKRQPLIVNSRQSELWQEQQETRQFRTCWNRLASNAVARWCQL